MGEPLAYGVLEEAELEACARLVSDTFLFASAEEAAAQMRDQIGLGSYRVLRGGGEVRATLCLLEGAHYLLGRPVPSAGVAVVSVPPERRRQGLATRLLLESLRELRERGIFLSSLYPSTWHVYRRVGYERAGSWVLHEVATQDLPVGAPRLRARRVSLEGPEELAAARAPWEARGHGAMRRDHAFLWSKMLRPLEGKAAGYVFEGADGPEGWVLWTMAREEPLAIRDWGAATPAACHDLLGLLGSLRTIVPTVHLPGAPVEPLLDLLPEERARVRHTKDWMVRLVDAPRALEARGYRPEVVEEVHLEVEDEQLEWNSGRFVLRVQGGEARCEPGGRGEVRLGIRELACLYTGHRTPGELRLSGELEGAEAALASLGRALAAPRPWMIDRF